MNHKYLSVIFAFILLASTSAYAGEFGTAQEAEALVSKAAKHIKKVGNATAFADFTGKKTGWVDRDLYVMVYDLKGKVLAHGQNEKRVGKDAIGEVDPEGNTFIKDRMELA